MIGKLMSAAMVIGLVQVGCASIDTEVKYKNEKSPAAITQECKKGNKSQCKHKTGAKHECKQGKKSQCDHKAGAKHECKKSQTL